MDYGRVAARVWRDAEDALFVEHDIELTPRALLEALLCRCPWGVSPYKGDSQSFATAGLIRGGLGCTRFSGELMRELPNALSDALAIKDNGVCPPGHWKMLDGRVQATLRRGGKQPHYHVEVPHHRRYHYGCACGGEHG
jgi:hypothetical protein